MVRVSGLEERLVDTTTSSHDADHSAALVAYGLTSTRRELDAGLPSVRILIQLSKQRGSATTGGGGVTVEKVKFRQVKFHESKPES